MVSWKGGLALIVLTVQNTSVPIMMRMARTGEQGSTHTGEYCVALLVLLQEIFKLNASIFLLIIEKRSVSAALHSIVREALDTPITTLNLAIPAILYFIMNNSIQHAAAYLPAAVFQVQGKAHQKHRKASVPLPLISTYWCGFVEVGCVSSQDSSRGIDVGAASQ
eukprot:1234787-Amorphochlora_amoeboformis.AAC.2